MIQSGAVQAQTDLTITCTWSTEISFSLSMVLFHTNTPGAVNSNTVSSVIYLIHALSRKFFQVSYAVLSLSTAASESHTLFLCVQCVQYYKWYWYVWVTWFFSVVCLASIPYHSTVQYTRKISIVIPYPNPSPSIISSSSTVNHLLCMKLSTFILTGILLLQLSILLSILTNASLRRQV